MVNGKKRGHQYYKQKEEEDKNQRANRKQVCKSTKKLMYSVFSVGLDIEEKENKALVPC